MGSKKILAIVGMPGAGKSEAVSHLKKRGIPCVRFGEVTDDEVAKSGLELNPDNERKIREKLRREFGMNAYALKSEPKIQELLKKSDLIALDGLYSWEEFIYLKERYPELTLIHIYAEPVIRYERLSKRPIRPVSQEKSRERDISELENLNKGGPIAIADFMIENNSDDTKNLYKKLDELFERIGLKI